MNRLPHIVIISLFFTLIARGAWRVETVDADGYMGRFTSIAVDLFGNPHISYLDEDNKRLRYASRDFNGWRTEAIDTQGTIESSTSITLDHRGIPHIAFYEKVDRDMWYATRQNGKWVTELVDSEGWSGGDPDIRIDRFGRPHISYHMDHPVIHVKYAVRTPSGWEVEKIGDDQIFGRATSLVLDSNETPHICYLFGWNLVLGTKIDDQWEFVNMFDEMQRGRSTSMEMDGAGRLHAGHTGVSFGSTSQELNILYTRPDGMAWQTEIIETFPFEGTDLVGWEESMVLDSDGTPHIVYYSVGDRSLRYAVRDGFAGWSIETVDDSGDVGMFCAAMLDNDDYIHVSYHDATNLTLKYATNAPEPEAVTGMELSVPEMVSEGLPFWVDGYAVNTGDTLSDTAVFVIMDVDGAFWFWPAWSEFDPDSGAGLAWQVMDIATGITRIEALPQFAWPDVGSLTGVRFIGAMVTSDLTGIIGELDIVEF